MKKAVVLKTISKLSHNYANMFYKNPCLELQQYVEIPLFKTSDLFLPTTSALVAAQNLFLPSTDFKIRRIMKTISNEKLPSHHLPEVAFVGRSNAGKSSLLKAILRNVPSLDVKTSKKPGHTKCFQFFQIGDKLCLVDMPGYGKNQPSWYEEELISYLQSRKNLVKVFLLTDGVIGIQETDKITVDLLENLKVPYCIIMTKIDKASDAQRLKNFLLVQNFRKESNLMCCFPHPFMISSSTHEGLGCFLAFLAHISGNLRLIE